METGLQCHKDIGCLPNLQQCVTNFQLHVMIEGNQTSNNNSPLAVCWSPVILFAASETRFFDPSTHVMLFGTTSGHFDFLGFVAYTEAVYFSQQTEA